MEGSILSILPNLGVGVVAIFALVYVTKEFLAQLKEREIAMRSLEKEVRDNITSQLMQNTQAMARIIDYLNKN